MTEKGTKETAREEAERMDRLDEEGRLDELPFTGLRRYAKEPSQVYAIRVPVSRLEAVRRLAEERGEQPTALMREWVLERLDLELSEPALKASPLAASAETPRRVIEKRSSDPRGEKGGERRRTASSSKSKKKRKARAASTATPPRSSKSR